MCNIDVTQTLPGMYHEDKKKHHNELQISNSMYSFQLLHVEMHYQAFAKVRTKR
jgi:hypothetical protein